MIASNPTHRYAICGGRILDPINGVDRAGHLIVHGDRVASIESVAPQDLPRVDATGLLVCPGLIDMHVHLREPGGDHKETIETGTLAAVAGGFSAVACMPNTTPAIDTVDTLRFVLDRSAARGHCRVCPIAAITVGRKGIELADIAALQAAGAVAFSDDGDGVEDDGVMRAAFEIARELDVLIIQHCEFKSISAGGVMHESSVSERLGFKGIDPRAEEKMIARDIDLVRATGARYHVAHISTAKAIEQIRQAKRDGLPVTTEVCPHHLVLTDEACDGRDPNTKMHPPLRGLTDVEACREGVVDGTIDCIVTDHAPHSESEKAVGFERAPFGIVGLETALPLAVESLVTPGLLSWTQLVEKMSGAPARILRCGGGTLTPDCSADITLIDSMIEWRFDPASSHSRSRNTPFEGRRLTGRAVATIVGGRLAYQCSDASSRFAAIPT